MSRLRNREDRMNARHRVGVVDGVAGSWTGPRYITVPRPDFSPGTRVYYYRVSQSIRRSYNRYKSELSTDD